MRVALLLILLAIPLPARADEFIIFRQGAKTSMEVLTVNGSTFSLPPGNTTQVLKPGDIASRWVVINGDRCSVNYTDNGGVTAYNPPPDPPVVPVPRVKDFKSAVLLDATIPNLDKLYLLNLVGVINDYTVNPDAVKAAWAIVKSTNAVSTTTAATVEAAAVKFNMPLN